jgi:L-aspartate oxidase
VLLVSKTRFSEGGASNWAQGGVAAAMAAGDTPWRHAADTVAVAGGIADRAAVELLTTRGPQRLRELLASGAEFDRDAAGELALGREAAHSAARILHAGGDATGAEMVRALAAAVRAADWIELLEDTFVEEPRCWTASAVVGVLARRGRRARAGRPPARSCSPPGGIGQAWRFTTNPVEATGDGLAMAARAGARSRPRVHAVPSHRARAPRDPLPLLTEALRGEGAVLLDGAGSASCSPSTRSPSWRRATSWRAPSSAAAARREVFLDAREAVGERFPSGFPTVFARCREQGFDPRVDRAGDAGRALPHGRHRGGPRRPCVGPRPVGVRRSFLDGRARANRLASNSLLEALVFGAEVGEDIAAPRRPRSTRVRRGSWAAISRRDAWHLREAAHPNRAAELRMSLRQRCGSRPVSSAMRDGLATALAELGRSGRSPQPRAESSPAWPPSAGWSPRPRSRARRAAALTGGATSRRPTPPRSTARWRPPTSCSPAARHGALDGASGHESEAHHRRDAIRCFRASAAVRARSFGAHWRRTSDSPAT